MIDWDGNRPEEMRIEEQGRGRLEEMRNDGREERNRRGEEEGRGGRGNGRVQYKI